MTTLNLHPWNFMPPEILERIFSFLPVRERHNVLRMCQLWASAVSSASVWRFTEVRCDSKETDKAEEDDDGGTSSNLLQKMQPYMGHIRYLKLVLDTSLELNRRLACTILDVMAWKRCRLQGIQVERYGRSPNIYSNQDIQLSLRRLFQGMDKATMQHVDFQKVPFVLENRLVSIVARCSPNLRTLYICNHGATLVQSNTIVEVLRNCPKLSTLGVPYIALSTTMFEELLRPIREPFKLLDLFCDSFGDIPSDCWTSVRERHPGFRVRLEFAVTVKVEEISQVLKPEVPIFELHFNSFTHIATQVELVTKLYARTLEKLVLHSGPYFDLNLALMQLAKACSRLKEIHCFCLVSQAVVDAFQHYCPHLEKYTLYPFMFFYDKPPMVVL